MAYKVASTADFAEQAEVTNTTNYFGTKSLTIEMLDDNIFTENSKVLFCSSMCSDTSFAKCNKNVQKRIKENENWTIQNLDDVAEDFINLADDNTHQTKYSNSAYGMSKLFVRKLCNILPQQHPHIKFYSYCPGWCKTDMAGYEKPPRTAEQGSEISYWLATTNDQVVLDHNGGFFRDDNQYKEWTC